jgi:DNA replication ATP-dependent helicase Dna2
MGMSESLFSRLDDPKVTIELNIQYRMNAEIMRLANELTYGGRLKCADDAVSRSTLPTSLVVCPATPQHVL